MRAELTIKSRSSPPIEPKGIKILGKYTLEISTWFPTRLLLAMPTALEKNVQKINLQRKTAGMADRCSRFRIVCERKT